MAAPVKNTCPDIDTAIKHVVTALKIANDAMKRHEKRSEDWTDFDDIDSELRNLEGELEDLRIANASLREWGEDLEDQLQVAAERIRVYVNGRIEKSSDKEPDPTHYLRPIEPSTDVEVAAREYADRGWKVDYELEKAVLHGYHLAMMQAATHAMMSKGDSEAEAKRMFDAGHDVGLKTALAKCREAEEEIREYREALKWVSDCKWICLKCKKDANDILTKYVHK